MVKDHVCMGDYVALYNERRCGYMGQIYSSSSFNNPIIYCDQDRNLPQGVPNMKALLFEICISSRYKTAKRYRKHLAYAEANPHDLALQESLHKLKAQADLEASDNQKESRRNFGRKIRFGEVIELKNVYTGKYIHIDDENMSAVQKSAMRTVLLPHNGKDSQFIIVPTYKVNSEGESIQVSAYVSLESAKARGHYLQASRPMDPEYGFQPIAEMNIGLDKDGFMIQKAGSISPNSVPKITDRSFDLRGLNYVHLYHQEVEAYITAEGSFLGCPTEDIHLRIRLQNPLVWKSLLPSSNPNTYWQIEQEKQSFNCNAINWQDQVRLRHGSTRLYLAIDDAMQLCLIQNAKDPRTVFKFIPVNSEFVYQENVRVGENVCISHVVSNQWLTAVSTKPYRKRDTKITKQLTMDAITWDPAKLVHVRLEDNKRYDDAFKLQPLAEFSETEFEYVSGIVPVISQLTTIREQHVHLLSTEIVKFTHTMKELKTYLIEHDEPVKRRQKLLRSFKIIDMLLRLLEVPVDHDVQEKQYISLYREIYEVIYNYLLGQSSKDKIYLARHFDLLHAQMETLGRQNGELGKLAIRNLTQLVRGQRLIIDRIEPRHIDVVIELLCLNKNHLYLIFLSEICVCKGISLPDKQNYITEKWLKGDQSGMYLLTRGQKIGRTRNILYISCDNEVSWMQLHVFVDPFQPAYNEDHCNFLMHQLDLFVSLSAGRNEAVIHFITKESEFISWDEAFICLQSQVMPNGMRAKLCEIIIGLFVDVGCNYSVVEHTSTSAEFGDIGQVNADSMALKDLATIFPLLRDWIFTFLHDNESMCLAEITRNKLIHQVFILCSFLVKYGYFDDNFPISDLIMPVMRVLDGRNDLPVNLSKPVYELTGEDKDRWEMFKRRERYRKSTHNKVLVDAKCAGLDLLTLIITCVLNEQVKSFQAYFKETYTERADINPLTRPPLADALSDDFDPYSKTKKNRKQQTLMQTKLKEMFQEREFFDVELLQQVLLDLTKYEYDTLLQKAVSVLTQFFSSKAEVFEVAQDSTLVINPRSVNFTNNVLQKIPKIIVLIQNRWTEATAESLIDIFKYLIRECNIVDTEIANPINQRILFSNNIINVLFEVFEKDVAEINVAPFAEEIYCWTLNLLAAVGKDNVAVQNVFFDRLDILLDIQYAQSALLNLLMVTFTYRDDLCERLSVKQIERVMSQLEHSEDRDDQLLSTISSFGRVKGSNTLIKKNMLVITKALMQYYKKLDHLFELSDQNRLEMLKNIETKETKFYLSLVYLMGTCAELENEFIESFCQTLLSLDEVMMILVTVEEPLVKRVFMKFLNEVFVKTAMSTSETGVNDIGTLDEFWEMLNIIARDCEVFLTCLRKMDKNDIYQRMADCALERNMHLDENKMFIYFLDGIVPLLAEIYCLHCGNHSFYSMEERQIFLDLTKTIHSCLTLVMPFCSNENQGRVAVNFLFNAVNANFSITRNVDAVIATIGHHIINGATPEQHVWNDFIEQYKDEIELNRQFNVFLTNCQKIYEGHNTAEGQLNYMGNERGFLHDSRVYSPIGQIESLPLGEEFQQLCHSFVTYTENTPNRRYVKLGVLVRQLTIAQRHTHLKGMAFKFQTQLNMICCQVLRAILHNEILRLSPKWEEGISIDDKNQLRHIRSLQEVLIGFNIQEAVMPLTRDAAGDTAKQVMALEKVLFFNPSADIQKNLYKYFQDSPIECFFYSIKTIFGLFKQDVKEIQNRLSMRLQEKAQIGHHCQLMRSSLADLNMINVSQSKEVFHDLRKAKIIFNMSETSGGLLKSSGMKTVIEDGYAHLILETMAGMCDVQYASLQNYFRSQEDNPKSYNLVSETCDVVASIYSSINSAYIDHLRQLFDTLCKLCTGNIENLTTILNGKIVDYMNYILRTADFPDCSPNQVINLRESVANLLIVLIEQDDLESNKLAKEILVTVDVQAIYRLLTQFYKMTKADAIPNLEELVLLTPQEELEPGCLASCKRFFTQRLCRAYQLTKVVHIKQRLYDVGFKYYQIIDRIHQLQALNTSDEAVVMTPTDKLALKYFKRGGQSIEILKDDCVQKVTFRVKNPDLLRESVKDTILWSVDRSSISSKIRDFSSWINSILLDVEYTHRVLRNPIVLFFTKLWYVWNWIPWIISIVIAVLLIVYYKATYSLTDDTQNITLLHDPYPVQERDENYFIALFWLGIAHNIFSGCLFVSFLVNAHPGFANVTRFATSVGSHIHHSSAARFLRKCLHRKRGCCKKKGKKRARDDNSSVTYSSTTWDTDDEEEAFLEARSKIKMPTKSADNISDLSLADNKLAAYVVSFRTLYYVLFLVLSITGTVLGHHDAVGFYFFAFHLINVVLIDKELNGIIKAIFAVLPSLFWVGILILVILYVFALIAFAFFRSSMSPNDNLYCDTLGHCFVVLIRFGFLFDKFNELFLPQYNSQQNFDYYVNNAIFTTLLFIIVAIIMYNIITGIIVDKFAEIRNLKWSQEKDMRELCFICGRTSYEFETQSQGFHQHIYHEHHMWAYVYFFIFLHHSKPGNLTALQLYVRDMLARGCNDFFPMSRALSLAKTHDNTEEMKIDEANTVTEGLLEDAKIMTIEKERYTEYMRQKQWYEEVSADHPNTTNRREAHRYQIINMRRLFPRIAREIEINSADSRQVILGETLDSKVKSRQESDDGSVRNKKTPAEADLLEELDDL